ncbi:MAG: type II toxin-antitoxin system ParD family antitoxin [Planctomycetes bacterium]|nr:type II toxin-antitoxin system ParD family antitoxin [Planctomycetota bacterium]
MEISLTDEEKQFIERCLVSGRFRTAGEIFREGLRLLMGREDADQRALDGLRKQVYVGVSQADRGLLLDGAEVFARLEEVVRARGGAGLDA